MTKLGIGALGNATYQISKFHAFQFQSGTILELVCFVPIFHPVTPGAGPILTQEASYKQTWQRSTRRCYILNIKTQYAFQFQGRRILKFAIFVSMFQHVTPGMG